MDSESLTAREVEVVRLVCDGLTDKHIANALHISPKTVQHHLAHAVEKARLQHSALNTRVLLVRWALREGLVRALCLALCVSFCFARDDALRMGRVRVRAGVSQVRGRDALGV